MRYLTMILALALAACATTPPPTPVTATGKAGITGAATIAQWGSWEWQIAPLYSTSATLRMRAAKQLEAGRITKGAAIAVQTACDRARASLDASRRGSADAPTAEQIRLKADAERSLAAAQSLLEL